MSLEYLKYLKVPYRNELAFLTLISLGPTRPIFLQPETAKNIRPSPQISLISDAHGHHLEPQDIRWNTPNS